MKKKHVSYIIIYSILTIITLAASVLAWVTLSKDSNLSGIQSNIPNFTKMIDFKVKRNNDTDYILIKTIDDMHSVFGKTKPGESYDFIVEFDNKLNQDVLINVLLQDFSNENGFDDYNILDVFYIDNGIVNINNETIQLDTNSNDKVVKHDQELNKYRISNLIDDFNKINLITNYKIEKEDKITVNFKIVYDRNTKDNNYQDIRLKFSGIYIYAN